MFFSCGGPEFLEALQFVEGFVERALQAGFVAVEENQALGGVIVGVGQMEPRILGATYAVFGVEAVEFQGGGFQLLAAAEAPEVEDELAEDGELGGGLGLVFFEEGVAELVEGVLVLGIEGEVFGGEAVFEGIEAGAELAFIGLGAGAFGGVAAVGLDLFAGSHGVYSWAKK